MEFLIVLAILAVVVLIVTAPLLRGRSPATRLATRLARESAAADRTELADLEAAREAKYREIRDAELDHRTGKLSDADYQAVDGSLRAEAIEILRRLDQARGVSGEGQSSSSPASEAGPRPEAR